MSLQRHPQYAHTLGLHSIPDRTTIGRWWIRYRPILEEVMNRIANIIKDNIRTTQLIVDSTSPKDMYDMEAKWGFTSRGPVKGFKIHAVVNQLGLPLRAIVTPCNRFDSIFLPKLIEDLEADFVLADAGYHSLKNIEAVKARVLSQSLLSTHGRQGKEVKCQMQCSLGVDVGLWSSLMGIVRLICFVAAGLGQGGW